MLIDAYIRALNSADPQDVSVFRDLLKRGADIMLLSDEDCARIFDVSRLSVTRWKNGSTKPHAVVRKLVFRALKARAKQHGNKGLNNMKMYILVKDSIPLGFAITAVGHAATAACLKWYNDETFIDWTESFKKVICKVNVKEFANAKEHADNIVLTESALKHEETAIVFKPRKEWPKAFKFYKLYK